jgi:hypothetical protein
MKSLMGWYDAQGRKRDEVGEVWWKELELDWLTECSTFTNALASLTSSLRFQMFPIFCLLSFMCTDMSRVAIEMHSSFQMLDRSKESRCFYDSQWMLPSF